MSWWGWIGVGMVALLGILMRLMEKGKRSSEYEFETCEHWKHICWLLMAWMLFWSAWQ